MSTAGSSSDSTPPLFAATAFFYAQCSASDAIGNAVYANSTLQFVSTADAANPAPVVGIIIAKSSPTNCTVQRYGESQYAFPELNAGQRYFLGDAGQLVKAPFLTSTPKFVQQVGNALSGTKLFIQPAGQVVLRDVTPTPQLQIFSSIGPPEAGVTYTQQNLYVDKDAGALYLQPTTDHYASQIYVGSGAPTDSNIGTPQDLYIDPDNGNLYTIFDDQDPENSQLILGSGAPIGSVTGSIHQFVFDPAALLLYPLAA